MIDPGPVAARASLDVARAALGQMMSNSNAPARIPPVTMAGRASEAWSACEHVLHNVTGRVDIGGQVLLAEARKQNRISLEDAHALVALGDWVERTRAPGSAAQMLTLPPTDAEREVGSQALVALQHAVASVTGETDNSAEVTVLSAPATGTETKTSNASASQYSPPALNVAPEPVVTDNWVKPPYAPPIGSQFAPNESDNKKKGRAGMFVAILLILAVSVGGISMYVLRNRNGAGATTSSSSSSATTDEGVAAYSRGAREAASIALSKAIGENPNDARAYTYLGRIAREDGNLVQARKYLEIAITTEPNNALALREMASALLADAQPDLARKFYIRALTIDPNDHVSQGFLACALIKLQRPDDAAPWLARAGQGDWSRCATATPQP